MTGRWLPSYLALLESGELARRAEAAWQRLAACDLCARACGANRLESAAGAGCHTAGRALVSSAGPHFGEEDPLVGRPEYGSGRGGSGTVFFAWCNLACQFCQNAEISQLGQGRPVDAGDLAQMMLSLQAQGCHNVNLVSPSHVVPHFLAALLVAARAGLRLPIVYNTGGYDALATLALLDGVVDIYMPDMKYADAEVGHRLSAVRNYPAVNQAAVKEMHRQVGDLALDERGVARRGLLVRHLVLPGGLAGTAEIVRFVAEEVSRDTYLNVMAQYRPHHRAYDLPPLDRPIRGEEYDQAVRLARAAGLRLDERRPRLVWAWR